MAEMSRIPKLTNYLAQTPAVSSHSVDEENTSVQIECEQVTAVAEQSETNSLLSLFHLLPNPLWRNCRPIDRKASTKIRHTGALL